MAEITVDSVVEAQQRVNKLLSACQKEVKSIERVEHDNRKILDNLWHQTKNGYRERSRRVAEGQKEDEKKTKLGHDHELMMASSVVLSECNRMLSSGLNSVVAERRKLEVSASKLEQSQQAEIEFALQGQHIPNFHNQREDAFAKPFDIEGLLRKWAKEGEGKAAPSSPRMAVREQDTLADDVSICLEENRTTVSEHASSSSKDGLDPETTEAMNNFGFIDYKDMVSSFEEADTAENVCWAEDKKGQRFVKSATLNKLVELLTDSGSDTNFRYVFLLTFPSFTTASELLTLLEERFSVPVPPNLTRAEVEKFKVFQIDKIRIKVCSVLKNWIDEHFADFLQNEALKVQLEGLIRMMLSKSRSLMITKLATSLNTRLKRSATGVSKRGESDKKDAPPSLMKPLAPGEEFSFLEANDMEVARQLTLIDYAKLANIQPREFLGCRWSKKRKEELAPGILSMIEQFNKVSIWTQRTIILEQDIKVRGQLFSKFIKVMKCCYELHNFYGTFAIYCGLTANACFRLKRTKELVDPSLIAFLEETCKTLYAADGNSRNIRRAMATSSAPLIPHIGLFLTDLTFTEDGNPNKHMNMINFDKRLKVAERIRWIQQYQQLEYPFGPVDALRIYFSIHIDSLDVAANSEKVLYDISRKTEAKIAPS